ncbi:hypothetical protein OHV05_36460 (plasmid) [Kitasatospora sp. NBC_00070]|uniref:hypothetical protein n=1 Tax=Kitasatospora sp. NBC_00070 TaxID=2975962 RepID=UPI002F91976D
MIGDLELFEGVCDALWASGFDVAHTRATGLQVGLRARGVLVGWRVERAHGSGERTTVPPGAEDGRREAVTRALASVLVFDGWAVTAWDGDLMVMGRSEDGRGCGP